MFKKLKDKKGFTLVELIVVLVILAILAALLVAALGADGTTPLRDPGHIRRGYADLPGEIRRLGAEIG